MSDDRPKPLWQWIVALLIGMPVLYVASFAPACWITSRFDFGAKVLPIAYLPIIWIWDFDSENGNHEVGNMIQWTVTIGAHENWTWYGRGVESEWRPSYY